MILIEQHNRPKEQHHKASGTIEYELTHTEEENEERMTTTISNELGKHPCKKN